MQVKLDPDRDDCPCGSGEIVARCCLRADGSLVPPSVPTPLPTERGFLHPGCYAAQLGGCSTKISREHAISSSVLEFLADGSRVNIGGLTWMPDEERRILPVSALASNVLCRNHNSALSGLDAYAARFVSVVIAIARDMATRRRRRPPAVYLFNGQDLERWMLKCLCGLVVSGTAEVNTPGDARNWRPPRLWLDCLFGLAPLPRGYGVWVVEPDRRWATSEFSLFSNSDVGPYGIAVSLFDRDFVFAMSRRSEPDKALLEGAIYRPANLWTTNQVNNSYIVLGWTGAHSNKTVQQSHANPRRSYRARGNRRI